MESEQTNSRVKFLITTIDILEEKKLETRILELLENGKTNQIVFLRFKDFLKSFINRDYRKLLNNAALVLPSSSILVNGIDFLHGTKSPIYINYDLILKILSILEKHKKSIYIIGSNKKNISISEKNLKDSYPGLQLVGRSSSIYQKNNEQDILVAIKKASPSLLLAGSGLKGQKNWLYSNKNKFNPGITLWSPDCFEIFAGRKKRPSKSISGRFMKNFLRSILKPWRIFYIFPLVLYYLTLLFCKLFKKY